MHVASLDMKLSRGRITNALIRLRGCRAGPRGVVYGGGGGGALQGEDLNRAAQAVSGVRKPLLIGGGFRGAPPGNFLKSMSLRMHFRPF